MYQVLSQVIRDYLIQNKTVSLEKIGVLTLTQGSISLENGQTVPQVAFEYDKRAETTPGLVAYAVEVLKKSASIVKSDVEYFLEESRQLMNIGTSPLVIDGIGYIFSQQQGGYGFSQESVSAMRNMDIHSSPYDTNFKDKTIAGPANDASEDTNAPRFQLRDPYGAENNRKKTVNSIAIIIGILLLAAVAYGIYYFVAQKGGSVQDASVSTQVDSVRTQDTDADATPETTATPVRQTPAPTAGLGPLKFVFEQTPILSRAIFRTGKLRSYGDQAAYDSITVNGVKSYRLYIAIANRNIDTARAKDSLFKYFQKPITIVE